MKKTVNALNKVTNWEVLRSLGGSRVLRSSYIWFLVVPIAAKFIDQFDFPIQATIFGTTHEITLSLPFSWISFYLASLFFSAASLLYSFACPKLIKDHKNFASYYQDGNGFVKLSHSIIDSQSIFIRERNLEVLYRTFLIAFKASGREQDFPEASSNADRLGHLNKYIPLVKREEMGDLFTICINAERITKLWVRCVLICLYIIGFYFIGKVAYQNFLTVIELTNK